VSVKLDVEPVPYLQSGTSSDGWRISDKRVVSLSSTYCTKLLDGKDRVLEVDVTCTPELVH